MFTAVKFFRSYIVHGTLYSIPNRQGMISCSAGSFVYDLLTVFRGIEMKKLQDFRIRDPFIVPVPSDRTYYMYGSTDTNTWKGKAVGFDVYRSSDLIDWEGPFAVFRPDADFWSDRDFWAPEVHCYQGRYYMFASFKAEGKCRGTQILVSDAPMGPFTPHSAGPVTPADWECLDGTLYVDDAGNPWMVFCHEWVQIHDGSMCAIPLSKALDKPAGEPVFLFSASEAPWVREISGAGNYVTDGPFMYRPSNGKLMMIWSSFGDKGYAVGMAHSTSGDITGPWKQCESTLFDSDGGHAMIFRTFEGQLKLTFHQPNGTPNERPVILSIKESENGLELA